MSTAKDMRIFMWILINLLVPKGVVEVTTANPNFYLIRLCIVTFTLITNHHEQFYSHIENKKSLPHIEPYKFETIREIQEITNSRFPKKLLVQNLLAREDTTLLYKTSHKHQDLIKKIPDFFPHTSRP